MELMVVVMIIALLMAVAIPTLLGSISRSYDRAAQSDLRKSLVVVMAIASDQGGWFRTSPTCAADPIGGADMTAAEPAVGYADGVDAEPADNQVGVQVLGGACSEIRLIRKSKSDSFFGLSARRAGPVGYCEGTLAQVSSAAPCSAPGW